MYRVVVRLVIPESPRWLAVHARYDEVTTLLQKMCRANKRQLPPDLNPKCLVDELNEVQYENFPLIIHNSYEHKPVVFQCYITYSFNELYLGQHIHSSINLLP